MDKIINKTAFIGHRELFGKNLTQRITSAIELQIKNGCKVFTMGTHGTFDNIALSACRNLRKLYKDIQIKVVITSLHAVEKDFENDFVPYSDVKTVMYNIEQVHFKQRITISNRYMLDSCNTLICYVDEKANKSGAKSALLYAKKNGMKIINLFREQDNPFYGMTIEEAKASWEALFDKSNKEL